MEFINWNGFCGYTDEYVTPTKIALFLAHIQDRPLWLSLLPSANWKYGVAPRASADASVFASQATLESLAITRSLLMQKR
ncbi:hypothetical protein H310_12887 [Aphanomyces invadans]|uniref:Uncharacterized protein n=1 Tax=Aphanomyces invadans TaxID=157072 RepID=A0A024TIB5_9STRA|nr:hypothetical protein H310_12887 [Aphanomyces invadans]ETV93092.1 hypothetical protein H310_12887 [Aphanomyces invadans]|eukprot:XP_008878357.1 hypothetical protein H310_12887 [Aphanomyces invadans]